MSTLFPDLKIFAPGVSETRVFQAALCTPERAFETLERWETSTEPDLVRFLAGQGKWMRGQQPLIYANVQDQLSQTALACRPYLKTATVRERKRYDVFLTCLTDAMRVLNTCNRPYCVVKGVAAANTVYPDPVLRHCHDLDLVVRSTDLPVFSEALKQDGFVAVMHPSPGLGSLRFDHPTGLPVVLHTRPVAGLSWIDANWMMQDALQIETPAGQMIVPSPARRIMHAWLHRFVTDRFQRHIWVPDTVLDLRQCQDQDIDALNAALANHPVSPEAFGAARYLAGNFDDLPQLSRLVWPSKTHAGRSTAEQRLRLRRYAQAADMTEALTKSLSVRDRILFTFDRVLPPFSFFESEHHHNANRLWALRARRIAKALWRRMHRT